MSHHGHALRQLSVDENGETVIRRKYTEDDHDDGCFYLYEYISKTKCKNNVAAFILYTVIWGRLISIDMPLHIFRLILITSTLQHLMEIVKNPVNLI